MKNIYFIVEGKTEKIFIDAIRKLGTVLICNCWQDSINKVILRC